MIVLLASLFHLVITAAIFHFLRKIVVLVTPRSKRRLAEEFVTTMDFCCGCCEMAVLCDNYGTIVYAVTLFFMCLWWSVSFGDASANPNTFVEDFFRGRASLSETGQGILIQLVAGSLVFTYMRFMWGFGWSEEHIHKSHENECSADLQVPVQTGAIVEGVITFVDRVNAFTLEDMDWKHSTITSAFLSTLLVVSALHSSGGYFNPVLASSLKFGCEGHSYLEFFFVYWIGSVAGSLVALGFHRFVGVNQILKITNLESKLPITSLKKTS